MKPLTFIIAEDRGPEEMGIRLALLSLRQHCPEATVFVFRPDPAPAFCRWLEDFPKVKLIPRRPVEGETWNCKPQALLEILDRGCEEAIWLDSDIMLTRSCASLFEDLSSKTMIVAEEMASIPHQGTVIRTQGWKLDVGRTFPVTMNSCVLRVTSEHRLILSRWKQLLMDPNYLAAQKKPLLGERPIHFHSDQDVLNALLGSQEFVEVPVRYLKRGRDIIHVGGARTYSLGERLAGFCRRIPVFLHSGGPKPWIAFKFKHELTGRFWVLQRLILETSPYLAEARRCKSKLGEDTEWLNYATPVGRCLRALGGGHFGLRGMPLTLIATIAAMA